MAAASRLARISPIILAIVWLGAFAGTHIPAPKLPETGASDKLLHTIGYAALALTFLTTMSLRGRKPARALLLAATILPAYGAIDEITQPLVNRFASIHDWYFDCLGIAMGGAVWLVGVTVLGQAKIRDGSVR